MRTNKTAIGVPTATPTQIERRIPEAPIILGGCHTSPISLLNLDVLRNICDAVEQSTIEDSAFQTLDGLSRTNHLLRDLTLPSIFRTTAIRGQWDTVMERLQEMRDCPLLPDCVRTFKFVLSAPDDVRHPLLEQLASALASLLAKMQKLEKLVLIIPEHHTAIFASEIAKAEFTLPAARTLVFGPFCDFVIQLCPNVTTIAGNRWARLQTKLVNPSEREHTRDLITAAGKAANVTSLEIMERWRVELVEAIHEALPQLTKLALHGGSYKGGIAAFVPALSRFNYLESLALADVYALGVGFHPPTCGNVYRGPRGKEVRERVGKECREAEERVARMVAPVCSRLDKLWIGDTTRAEVLRDADGSFRSVVWHRGERREKVV